jgi:hypothetical protein
MQYVRTISHMWIYPHNKKWCREILQKLNPTKAAGPDNIRLRELKELSNELAPILPIIFNRSINTGEVSPDWGSTNVNPV